MAWGTSQISQVRGYADQLLRVKNDPLDPSNRRISLIVQWVEVPQLPASAGENGKEPKSGETPKTQARTQTESNAKPAAR
jgi:chemotaxis protein MotB